ncbi:hypothetical protein BDZ89DRAFT_1135731 [Hymenopellis radicata]|nr:hypothetical protein BDZ89DRAFT_1135731 [Hymenopellis radicata]
MSTTFEDYGLSVADVQSLMSAALNSAILFVFCHGTHTCIFLVALYYIVQSAHSDRKRTTFAAIIAFLWCANTIFMGLTWNVVNETFIVHGTSLEAEFSVGGTSVLVQLLIRQVLRFLSVFLADLILIWRCWVLYGGDLKIVAVPSLCLITETIAAGFLVFYTLTSSNETGASQAVWTLVYYLMTMVTNSLCTFLLLFRNMSVRGIGAIFKTSRGVIEVFVESAAMYAAIYIALLVVYTYEFYSPRVLVMTAYTYPQMISYSVTGIAPTLIIARVMAGQSRPNNAPTPPTLPNMRSTMHSPAESLQFAGASSHGTRTGRTNTVDLERRQEIVDDEPVEGRDMHHLEAPTPPEKRIHVTSSEGNL